MKSLRRLTILIIFLLVSVATMATGVFAWFIDYGNGASVQEFGSQTVQDRDFLEINAEKDGIFLGDRIRDLIYLTTDDFNFRVSDFYGYASMLEFDIINNNEHDSTATVYLNVMAAPEFQQYAGTQSGLKYLVLTDHPTLTQSQYLIQQMNAFQQSGNIFSAMTAHNSTSIEIPSGQTKTVYVYIWGYYDGLTEAQKLIYHALVYRVKVMV